MKELLILFCLFILSFNSSFSQESQLEQGYYVTVAVYPNSKENLAQKLTKSLSEFQNSGYGYSPKTNYYYVYIFNSANFKTALDEMRSTRQNTEYKDAWVYVYKNDISSKPLENQQSNTSEKIEQASREAEETAEVTSEDSNFNQETILDSKQDTYEDKTLVNESKANVNDSDTSDSTQLIEDQSITTSDENEENGLKVFFNAFNGRNRESIDEGKVQVIDVARAKLIDAYTLGDSATLADPNNESGELALIVENFGYRKRQLNFNYHKPDSLLPYVRKVEDYYVIDFEMARYRKGDIVVMYNVFFYTDAAIMQSESKYELNSLLALMKENPNYEIKIHGHTNGKRAGKIISLGESDNLFALNENNKEGFGSAKKLSKERAEIVKEFLIKNGINESRIKTQGWGGKRMIHPKIGNAARQNVRVEVEILKDQ